MSDSCQAIESELRQLLPDALDYPPVLRPCSTVEGAPPAKFKGHLGILDKPLTGFFCSVRTPGDVILKTYDLARNLRNTDVAIIGGFQSPMEKEFLDLLLRGMAPVVVCPARGLSRMRVPGGWKKPLAEGRLLLLSFFGDDIRRTTANFEMQRNAYIAALADRLLVAHAQRGSKTEELCKQALVRGDSVFTLDSADNAHLIELGAIPVSADDPTPLIAETTGHAGYSRT